MNKSDDPRNAILIARRDLDRNHTVFTVRPDKPITFTAGQWTELGLPKVAAGMVGPSGDEFVKDGVVRRAYSICSAPESGDLEFYFNRVEEGQLTRWLWELNEGDRLYVDPETRGHFTFDALLPIDVMVPVVDHEVDTADKPDILFVATGTGVAPFLSMIRHFALGGNPPWKSLCLIQGTRHRALLACEKQLQSIADEPENRFHYIPTLSREPDHSDWNGERGRVTEVVRAKLRETANSETQTLDISKLHVYLCGNATMIAAVEGELMPHGLIPRWQDPTGSIHTEVYY
jgi:ferredoxin/flavodoxin---NADP+ reductase